MRPTLVLTPLNDTGNLRFPVSIMGVSTKVGTMLRIKPYFASRNWPKANINAGRSPALVSVSFNMSRTLDIRSKNFFLMSSNFKPHNYFSNY